MMRIFKKQLYLLLLSCFLGKYIHTHEKSSCAISKNTWLPRAFSSYNFHDLIVLQQKNKALDRIECPNFKSQEAKAIGINIDQDQINIDLCKCTSKPSNLIISLFTEYMNNFSNRCANDCHSLGAMPFWSGTNTMTYGNNNGKADLDAYQLGLGNIITDDNGIGGVIQLNPVVQLAGVDGVLYFTYDKDNNGIFCKLHFPFGAMMIHPNMSETPSAKPDNKLGFSQTTLNPNSEEITYDFVEYPTPEDRPQSLKEAFFGGSPAMDRLQGNRPHIVRLRRARIEPCKQTAIRFGDISASIGYNRYSQKSFFSVGAKFSFPTGNVPTADHMLEPIFGRAGSWAIGAEFSEFYKLWESNSQNQYLNIEMQAELLHVMPGVRPSFRTFDLKQNGLGSKYLLVANYRSRYSQANEDGGFLTSAVLDTFTVQPFANISTLPVFSKIDIEGAFSVMFDFGHNNWNFAIGAECWGRTAEKICIDAPSAIDLRLPNLNDYAVLGRQVNAYLIDGQPGQYFTYYCEPLAKINKSQEAVQLVGSVPDVFALATPTSGGTTNQALLPEGIKDARLSENRIPEKFSDALDICGACAPSAISGKLFAQIGHTWKQHCHMPTISAIAGIEWNHNSNVHIHMWSIGLQGSINI
jgi:hypothetical protein